MLAVIIILSELNLTGALFICGGLVIIGIVYTICWILDKKNNK